MDLLQSRVFLENQICEMLSMRQYLDQYLFFAPTIFTEFLTRLKIRLWIDTIIFWILPSFRINKNTQRYAKDG